MSSFLFINHLTPEIFVHLLAEEKENTQNPSTDENRKWDKELLQRNRGNLGLGLNSFAVVF